MGGRVNQKRRTRQALVDAAVAMLRDGREVTIAGVAEAAQVSNATAYRYFSEPHELVLASAIAQVPRIMADLPDAPETRLDRVVCRIADLQLADEALWKAALAATLEVSAADRDGNAEGVPAIRSGARLAMTRRALEPLEDELGPELHRRLAMAVMLVYGMEALVVTRDACDLEAGEAKEVMRWAAQALLRAARAEAGSR